MSTSEAAVVGAQAPVSSVVEDSPEVHQALQKFADALCDILEKHVDKYKEDHFHLDGQLHGGMFRANASTYYKLPNTSWATMDISAPERRGSASCTFSSVQSGDALVKFMQDIIIAVPLFIHFVTASLLLRPFNFIFHYEEEPTGILKLAVKFKTHWSFLSLHRDKKPINLVRRPGETTFTVRANLMCRADWFSLYKARNILFENDKTDGTWALKAFYGKMEPSNHPLVYSGQRMSSIFNSKDEDEAVREVTRDISVSEVVLAIAMAWHSRLGANSLLGRLDIYMSYMIVHECYPQVYHIVEVIKASSKPTCDAQK